MSKTLVVSDETYESLERQARIRELDSVEKFLEELTRQFENEKIAAREKELAERREVVDRIRKFRKKMKEKYGVMGDSTELVREDRMRG